ncbi:two-component regulator propeller domain-containing protein [soil metagenome]
MNSWSTHIKSPCYITVFLLLLSVHANSFALQFSSAQNHHLKKHYISENWTTEKGLPINHINQVYQTPDGFLWLATFNGLIRFDGVSFKEFNSGNSPDLPSNRIITIQQGIGNSFWLNTEQGNLVYFSNGIFTSFEDQLPPSLGIVVLTDEKITWIATDSGLYTFSDQELIPYKPDFFGDKTITDIYRSSDGLLRVYDDNGLEWLLDSENGTVTSRETLIDYGVVAVAEDKAGMIWIGRNKIAYSDNNTFNTIDVPREYSKIADGARHLFYSLKTMPDGSIMAMGQSGLMKIINNSLTVIDFLSEVGYVSYAEVLGASFTTCPDSSVWVIVQDRVYKNGSLAFKADAAGRTIYCDNEQNLWITTLGNGLFRYREALFKNITFDHSNNIFYGVFQDSYGTTWIGSYFNDLTQMDASGQAILMELSPGYGLTTAFLESADGSLWNGPNRCTPENRTDTGACLTFEHMPGFTEVGVFAIHQDREKRIWFGTSNYLLRANSENFDEDSIENLGIPTVRYFLETTDGDIWMATNGEGVYRYNDGKFDVYNIDKGLSSNNIRALFEDEYGYIWVASEDRGLNRIDPDTDDIDIIRKSDGLFEDGIHKMLLDDYGRMWMSTNQGIFWVEFTQLHEFASGLRSRVYFTAYNERDGMLSREANGGFQNAGYKSPDGQLFFATQKGITVVDPGEINGSYPVPAVTIEDITSAGKQLFNGSDVTSLNSEQRSFTIQYNSPFYLAPERIRFRYKLEGFDKTWMDAGPRREAIFTNIPAGKYTFKVFADLGERDDEPHISSHDIVVSPYFYETAWLPISIFLLVCILVFGGYQLRLKHLLRKEKILENLVLKRTEDLRSEKKKTEEQAAQLKILSQEKNRLFANISHEFRTPLTLTIGPLTDLRDGKYGTLTPVARQQAELSLLNARRLLRLVGQLMDLARLEDNKFELNLKTGNLSIYLRTVAEPFIAAAEQKKINFKVLMPQEPIIVQYDPEHFDKIVANLLSNAFKFTPENGTITLELRKESEEALIIVSDTGPGIDPEHLPRLFDRFYQVQKSEMQPGSGIGLSLAKELTELHGNKIEVESKLNEGSKFIIRIPLPLFKTNMISPISLIDDSLKKQVTKQPDINNSLLHEKNSTGIADENRELLKTILIVDDHAEIRAYLRRHLDETYNIIEAASGSEAQTILKNHLPDLIISDVMMPDGDGFSLLKEIRSNSETDFLPVILLTARAEVEDKLKGLGIGANDYITKPFNMREINVRIQNLFDQQKRLKNHFVNGRSRNVSSIHHDTVKSDSTDQIFLNAVKMVIQNNLSDENFSVEELALKVNQSRSNLHRRLTKLTGETPSAMIRRIRLELGAQLLSQNAGTVSEIAYSIGFKNVAHFSRVFREHFNQSPTEYSAAFSDIHQ